MDVGRQVLPFLKWAGGKRWFAREYSTFLPSTFNRYVEPFAGSAAVFFHLRPRPALLSDVNAELVGVYCAIKERPDLIARYLARHQAAHSKDHYYRVRATSYRSSYARAARTIYLNRTCWNALYRVNQAGQFNVPIGTKTRVCLPSDDFVAVAALLSGVEIRHSDFEPVVTEARKGDFVFVDPPYTVKHNLNGFLKYNEQIFRWEDQERLRGAVEKAVRRGAQVLVMNADHESVRDLYRGFRQVKVERTSVIAASREHRGRQTELAIQCWK